MRHEVRVLKECSEMFTDAGRPQPSELLLRHVPCPVFHSGVSGIPVVSLHHSMNSSKVGKSSSPIIWFRKWDKDYPSRMNLERGLSRGQVIIFLFYRTWQLNHQKKIKLPLYFQSSSEFWCWAVPGFSVVTIYIYLLSQWELCERKHQAQVGAPLVSTVTVQTDSSLCYEPILGALAVHLGVL